MTFTEAVATGFRKYVEFTGRASRSEFWCWVLFTFVGSACLQLVSAGLAAAFSLATLLPSITVGVRRLHDIDRSGWWVLIWLVPLIGWVFIVIWGCTRGDEGPNRFGLNPLIAPAPTTI